MSQEAIVSRLVQIKNSLRLSVSAIAHKAGIPESNMSKMLRGRLPITDRSIVRISKAFGVSFDWLLSGEGEMFPQECQPTIIQNNEAGDNLENSIKVGGATEDWLALLSKRDEQIDRLLAIIENMQKADHKPQN